MSEHYIVHKYMKTSQNTYVYKFYVKIVMKKELDLKGKMDLYLVHNDEDRPFKSEFGPHRHMLHRVWLYILGFQFRY